MRSRSTLAVLLLVGLSCAGGGASGGQGAPEAPVHGDEPGELLDCSYEYGVLPSAQSYVRAINDVAGSYLAAQRQHETLRRDPNATSKDVDEAWRARVGAAQTLLRACRCWEQLDRVAYTQQVLAAEGTTTKKLKAEIGQAVATPCQRVFQAEATDR